MAPAAARVIGTDAGAAFAALLIALERRAAAVAQARAQSARMAKRGDDRRWRLPGLLWPLFGRGR